MTSSTATPVPADAAATQPAEAFLAQFHDQRPGCTSTAFGAMALRRDGDGAVAASGYHALRNAVRAAPDGPVLDIACGDGWLLAMLAADGRATAGIDLSTGELRAARTRCGPEVALVRGRAQALPFADGAFGAVVSHMSLMLMQEPEAVAREIRRVLRPGGRLAYLVPGRPGQYRDATTAAFVQALRRQLARADRAGLRFGGRAWCDEAAAAVLLQGSGFANPTISHWQGIDRHTVAEAWADFQLMYDIDFVDAAALPTLQRDFEALAAPLVGEDGRLDRPWSAVLVEATAA